MRSAPLLMLALVLGACGPGASDTESAPDATSASPESSTPASPGADATCTPTTALPGGDVTSAPADEGKPWPWDLGPDGVTAVADFDVDQIIRGGPPPDGIRPIEVDDVCFDGIEAAGTWLADDEAVMVVEVDGDVRGYPLAIMTQHEIANDVIAGIPVVVTYCPLCNSGLAFERTVDGEVLTFGTSGRLFQSNLVMYDRQHRNLWSQFSGTALVGTPDDDLTGTELVRLPTSLLGFGELRDVAPDALVLSPDVDPRRDYGRNPYPGYDDIGIDYGLFRGRTDDTLPPNTRVVGLGGDDDAVAVPLPDLQDAAVVDVDLADGPVTVWWAPGASSALDAPQTSGGRDVGQTAAFVPVAPDGTRLTFAPATDDPTTFVDDQSGSRWNLLGRAEAGPLVGVSLTAVAHDDTFWFVWFAFRPATTVHR